MLTTKKLKICLIGNSHSGCFKSGWDAISEYYPEVEIAFFPHCGNFYGMFEPDFDTRELYVKNEFVRKTFERLSGNNGRISLPAFDLCIIVGGFTVWGGALGGHYSAQVQKQAAVDFFNTAHISVLIKKIRQLSDVEILAVHNPFAAFRKDRQHSLAGYDPVKGMAIVNELAGRPQNVTVLLQPEDTRDGLFASRLEFAAGERLTGASLVPGAKQEIIDDLVHMNAAYGALFLSRILQDRGFSPKNLKLPVPDGHLPFAQRNTLK
jgi:hypothetical protein